MAYAARILQDRLPSLILKSHVQGDEEEADNLPFNRNLLRELMNLNYLYVLRTQRTTTSYISVTWFEKRK